MGSRTSGPTEAVPRGSVCRLASCEDEATCSQDPESAGSMWGWAVRVAKTRGSVQSDGFGVQVSYLDEES